MAVDDYGNAWSYTGASWTESTPDSPGAGLTAVSCVSSTFCMAVDNDGNTVMYKGAASTPSISNMPDPLTGTVGGGFTATVSTTGDGTKTVTSSTSSVCTTSGLVVTYVGPGSCVLTAHMATGTNYTGADGVPVLHRDQPGRSQHAPSISNMPAPLTGAVGGGFTATVSTTGDGTKTVTSSTSSVCTTSGLVVTYVGPGSCVLTAHVATGTNYTGADGVAESSIVISQGAASTPSISNMPALSPARSAAASRPPSPPPVTAPRRSPRAPHRSAPRAAWWLPTWARALACSPRTWPPAPTTPAPTASPVLHRDQPGRSQHGPSISNMPAPLTGAVGGGFTATVSTTGDGTKTVTSSTSSVCTTSTLVVTYVGPGSCVLTAHILATGTNYTGADGVTQLPPS